MGIFTARGKRNPVLICVFLLLTSAADLSARQDLPLGRITIEGLKRTRPATILRILNVGVGEPWNQAAREVVERRLRNFGTFSNISLKESVREGRIDLLIHLEDRWTLFPVPIVTTGSGASYGFGVFERNFLGLQKNGGMIFLIKQKKPRIFALYNDPHFFSWNWEMTITAGFSEDRIVDFLQEQTTAAFSLRYRFSDNFSLLGGLRFTGYRHGEGEITPVDGDSWLIQAGAEFNRLFIDEDSIQGFELKAEMDRDLGLSDFSITRLRTTAAFYLRGFADHTLAATAWLSLSDRAPYGYGYEIGGKGGGDTLPVKGYRDNEFIAGQVLSGNLEYRVPVLKSRGFIFSGVGFTDYALFADSPSRLFSGKSIASLGLALRLYVRRVAVPAFQIYGAYVPERKTFEVGLWVGAGPGRR